MVSQKSLLIPQAPKNSTSKDQRTHGHVKKHVDFPWRSFQPLCGSAACARPLWVRERGCPRRAAIAGRARGEGEGAAKNADRGRGIRPARALRQRRLRETNA